MSRFKGKVAVVTGGGNGIGAETATRLAAEGAAVIVADVDKPGAEGVRDKIVADGGRAIACHTDIRMPEQVEAMFEAGRKAFGPAGILVNTAGVGSQKAFLDTPVATLAAMYDVNVKGTFLCTQAGARDMVKLGGGRIVNFSSHSGLLGSSGRAAYITGQTISVDGGFTAAGLRVSNPNDYRT